MATPAIARAARPASPVSTALVYDALRVPLRDVAPQARGGILEAVARRRDERRCGAGRVVDAAPGARCDGSARGANTAANDYDVLLGAGGAGGARRRVEVKSAQLKWNKSCRRWWAQFTNIKPACFDALVLVLYAPSGLYVLDYDLVKRRGMCGAVLQSQAMAMITMLCPTHQTDCAAALAHLLAGHLDGAERIAFDAPAYADVLARRTVTHAAYVGAPLAALNGKLRGAALEAAARRWDAAAGLATLDPPADGLRRNGARRGRASATYDYGVAAAGGAPVRVEVKSAQLKWDKSSRRWWAQFVNIHREHHDALRLVLYTPRGAYACRWAYPGGATPPGWTTAGRTGACHVAILGPKGERRWEAALEVVLGKLPPGEWLPAAALEAGAVEPEVREVVATLVDRVVAACAVEPEVREVVATLVDRVVAACAAEPAEPEVCEAVATLVDRISTASNSVETGA